MREPTPEELDALDVVQEGGAFSLVLIRYRGEYRHALAVEAEDINGTPVKRLLAIVIDPELDAHLFSDEVTNELDVN